jgi:sterol desaturase/sphingolipid hydroxylase (fatty acid hydroxylase superfamily)
MSSRLPIWVAPAVIVGAFVLFLVSESFSPLRRQREWKLRRVGRNLAMAGIGLATIELLQIPILLPVSKWVMTERIGLIHWLRLAGLPATIAAILLLDYTLWFWHRANHRVPFFWRFHSVHHVDLDMDASTALRFHFGELGFSVGVRAVQIIAIGASPLSVAVYQLLLFAAILFHHSNTRLPVALERVLVLLIVTPRMHGIHHSDYRNETDSNWANLLSVWDYLHGTIRLDVPQQDIEIGVAAYQDPSQVTIGKILAFPFRQRRDDWIRTDGRPAVRPEAEAGKTELRP